MAETPITFTMSTIPLEQYPELATQYGVAFGWINLIQEQLKWKVLLGAGLNPVPDVVMDVFDEMTLGQMINTASRRIKDKKLIGYLHDLNNKRRILAHGLVGEKAYTSKDKPPVFTGELSFTFKKETYLLSELLEETIKMAKKIGDKMKSLNY